MNELQKIKYKRQEYFKDMRLKEFRPTDKPFLSIQFNSPLGQKILAEAVKNE